MKIKGWHSYQRQTGLALVIVLWLVALLALMAVSHGALHRTETVATNNQLQASQARAAAQAGIQLAILDLLRTPAARQLSSDGTINQLYFGEASLHIAIVDESGKVDINAASGPLLDALLMAAGMEEESLRIQLVDAILDWRDSDQLRRVNGAEDAEYQVAGLNYAPRNGPFQSIEELALVLGMSAPLYHRLERAITIYSGAIGINSLTATTALLAQLDGDDETAPEQDLTRTVTTAITGSRVAEAGRVFTVRCESQLPGNARHQLETVVRLTPRRGTGAPLYEILLLRQLNEIEEVSSG